MYHSASGTWDFIPPAQTAGPASVSYDKAPKMEGWVVAGTIHSHASMSAFHSGTDHADEEFFDGVHITIGKLDSVPEYSCSIMAQGKRAMMDPSELIDGMAPQNMVPAAWVSAMKLSAPRGLDKPFAARAEALYQRYWNGEIPEEAYKAELGKIEEAQRETTERTAPGRTMGDFMSMTQRHSVSYGGKPKVPEHKPLTFGKGKKERRHG